MAKLLTVKNNTAPPYRITLLRDGVAIDVTGCSVDFYANLAGTVTNSGHTACALTTPAAGIITYTAHASDFTTPGLYNCEVKITYADLSVETIRQKFQVDSRDDLQ